MSWQRNTMSNEMKGINKISTILVFARLYYLKKSLLFYLNSGLINFVVMRNELEDIQELQELEKQQEEITRRRNVILKRMEKRIRFSSGEIEKTFPSKIAAIEYVLKRAGSAQHIKKIVAEITQLGFVSHERTISGMLRNYVRQGKTFTAEKGNKFGLTDWSKEND